MNVLNGILGTLTVDQRFSHLRCSFQLHLDHSSSTNPIRTLISSSNSRQFLYSLQSDPLYNQFKSLDDLPTNHLQLKKRMATFLLSRRSVILSQSKSVLVNYIPITARSDSLIDKVLRSPIKFQRTFLSWRRGSLFLNSTCVCTKRWHRGHISCLPTPQLTLKHRSNFEKMKDQHTKNFCQIDYLLNVQEWDYAWDALQVWKEKLSSKKS